MKKDMFEETLTAALHGYADGIEGNALLDCRVKAAIAAQRTAGRVRHRRLVVGLAAALCLAFTGALAGGRVSSWMSSTSPAQNCATAAELQAQTAAIADNISVPEKLGDLPFQEGSVIQVRELLEDDTEIGAFPEMNASYGGAGDTVMLTARAEQKMAADTDETGLVETRQVNDIVFSYYEKQFLYAGEGYPLTAEQQAAVDAGQLTVSYDGRADNRCEEMTYQFVRWTKDGVCYTLSAFDRQWTAQQWLDLATEAADLS